MKIAENIIAERMLNLHIWKLLFVSSLNILY